MSQPGPRGSAISTSDEKRRKKINYAVFAQQPATGKDRASSGPACKQQVNTPSLASKQERQDSRTYGQNPQNRLALALRSLAARALRFASSCPPLAACRFFPSGACKLRCLAPSPKPLMGFAPKRARRKIKIVAKPVGLLLRSRSSTFQLRARRCFAFQLAVRRRTARFLPAQLQLLPWHNTAKACAVAAGRVA